MNELEFHPSEFQEIWKQVERIVEKCNIGNDLQQLLFENKEEETIIKQIKNHKVFQHIKDEQTITLRKDLQQLWSSSMFKQSIQNLNIDKLILTPYMLEIVVQVLPQLISQESNQYSIKGEFQNNLLKVLKQSSRSNKYLKIHLKEQEKKRKNEVKKEEGNKFDHEAEEVRTIFEKLQKQRFFFNYSPIDKIVVQNESIITSKMEVFVGKKADLVAVALNLKKFTIFEFYDYFTKSYHDQQIQKLIQLGKVSNLDSFTIDVFNFSQSLALDLTINQLIQIDIKQKGKLKLNIYKGSQQNINQWEQQYMNDQDDNTEYMKLIRSCVLLGTKGTTIQFNHKSIQEFFVAKYIFDQVSSLKLILDPIQEKSQKDQIINSIYNKNEFNLSKDNYLGVMTLLKPQLEYLSEIDEKLIYLVKLSVIEDFVRTASNSIYLLSQRNIFLGGKDFKQIRLRDTSLFGLSFFGSDLSDSFFENIVIDSCNFNFCKLNNTSWNKIICKEMPYLQGHSGTIFVVTFSHDGQLLASGGSDSQVIIWDLSTFKENTRMDHKESDQKNVSIKSVLFFQNSQKLATAGSNQTIKIFDVSQLPNWKLLRLLEDHGQEIIKIKFSFDEKTLYSLDLDGYVIIWDVEKVLENEYLEMRNVVDLVFNSTGQSFFAIDNEKKTIGFYEFETKNCINFISTSTFNFTKLTISKDDNYLASANEDGLVVIWDVSQKNVFKLIWYEENFEKIDDFSFSPDNHSLSILCDTIIVNKDFLNYFQTDEQVKYLNCDCIAFSQTDDILALLGKDIIHISDLIINQVINSISFLKQNEQIENLDKFDQKLMFSKTQQLACQYRQDLMSFWNMNQCLKQFEVNIDNEIVLLSQDFNWLIDVNQYALFIKNLEKKSQKKAISFKNYTRVVLFTTSFSGSLIAFSSQKQLIVLDLNNIEEQCMIFDLHNKDPKFLAFSQQGQYLFLNYSSSIFSIQMNSNYKIEEFQVINIKYKEFLATSFDDKILGAVTVDNQIILWDIKSKQIIEIGEKYCQTKILFSPKDETVAFGDKNQIYLFNYSTKEQKLLQLHQQQVIDLAFSSDHQYFASIGEDCTIILQNLISAKITKMEKLEAKLRAILFIDSQNLITVSNDFIKIWAISSEDMLTLSRTKYNFYFSQIQYQESQKRILFLQEEQILIYYFDEFFDFIIIESNGRKRPITMTVDSKLIGYDLANKIRIYSLETDQNECDLNTREDSSAIAFSNSGQLLANYQGSKYINIWNLQTREIIRQIPICNSHIKELSFCESNQYLICKGSNSIILDISNLESIYPVDIFFQNKQFLYTERYKYKENNFIKMNVKKNFVGFNQLQKRTIIKKFRINNNQKFYYDLPYYLNKLCYSVKNYLAAGGNYCEFLLFHLNKLNQMTILKNASLLGFTKDEKLLVITSDKDDKYQLKLIDPENSVEQILESKSILPFNTPVTAQLLHNNILIIIYQSEIYILKALDLQIQFIAKMHSNNLKFANANSNSYFGLKYRNYFKCLSEENIEQKEYLKSSLKLFTSIDVSTDQKFLVLSAYEGIQLWNLEKLTFELKKCSQCKNSIFIMTNQIVYSNNNTLFLSQIDQLNIELEIGQTSKIINTIQYSIKNEMLITADDAQKILLWDIKARSYVAAFQAHSQQICSAIFSPNGQIIASGGQNKLIRLWNANTNKNVTTQDYHLERITCLKFSPDGLILASASFDYTIKFWNISSKRNLCCLLAHTNPIIRLIFSQDQKFLLSCDSQNIILWIISNLNNIQSIFIVQNFCFGIQEILFSKNGDILFLHNDEKDECKYSNLWTLKNNIERSTKEIILDEVQSYQVLEIQSLIAYLKKGKIYIFNLKTKESQRCAENNVTHFVFSQDEKTLATINQEFVLSFWFKSREPHWEKYQSTSLKYQMDEDIKYLKFSQDNKQLNFISSTHFSTYLLQSSSKKEDEWLDEKLFTEIQFFSLDQNRNLVILAHQIKALTVSYYITVQKLEDCQLVKTFKGYESEIQSISFSFDDKYFSGGCKDGKIYVWDYQTEILQFEPYQTSLNLHSINFVKSLTPILISCNYGGGQYQRQNKFTKIDLLNQQQTFLKFIHQGIPPISPFGNLFVGVDKQQHLSLFALDLEGNLCSKKTTILEDYSRFYSHSFNLNQTFLAITESYYSVLIFDIQKGETIYKFIQQIFYQRSYYDSEQRISFLLNNQIILFQQNKKILFRVNIEKENQQGQANHFSFPYEILQLFVNDDQIFILTNQKELHRIKTKNINLRRYYFKSKKYETPILTKNEQLYFSELKIAVYDTINMTFKKEIDLNCNTFSLSTDELIFAFAIKGHYCIVKFIDLENHSNANKIQAHEDNITSLVISQNSSFLATKSNTCIKLWDISDIKNPSLKFIIPGESQNEQFTSDSLYFCRQIYNKLIIQEIEKLELQEITYQRQEGGQIEGMKPYEAYDNINQLILVYPEVLYHYEINNQKLSQIAKFHSKVSIFEYSDVSKIFAYSIKQKENVNNTIYILEIQDLQINCRNLENAHNDYIVSISFSLDGMFLLSGSLSCIKIWDLEKHKQLIMINNLSNFLNKLSFSPDGVHFASGTANGAVSLYITNISRKKFMKKKARLLEPLGDENRIGCLKEFSQQPLLQKSNTEEKNLMMNLENPSVIALFNQKQ